MSEAVDFDETKVVGWGLVEVGFRIQKGNSTRGELIVREVSILLERTDLDILATAIRKWLDMGDAS